MDKRWPALVVVALIEAEGLVVLGLGQCSSSGNGNLRLTPPSYIGEGGLRIAVYRQAQFER